MIKKFDDPLLAMQAVAELHQRSKIIKLNDFEIIVRTLGTKDETDTFINCMNLWGQAFIYKHKIETLILAITHINGLSLENVNIEKRREIINLWNQEIVDEIYLEYAKLIGSIEKFLQNIQLTAETNVIGAKDAENKKEMIKLDSNEGEEHV
jgi:hypothetical protein